MLPDPVRILLVEDQRDVATLVRDQFAMQVGRSYEVEHVQRVDEALEILSRRSFDAILLDLSLPDSAGLETFYRVHAQVPGLPIVVLTGLEDESLAVQAVREGAQDYLFKGGLPILGLTRSILYALERKRFHNAFEYAAIGMAFVSLEGRFLEVNGSLCQQTGFPRAEVLSMTWAELLVPEDVGNDAGEARRLLAGEIESYSTQKRYRTPDGQVRWGLWHVSYVREAAGRPLYSILQLQDITQRKWAESELATKQAELERSNRELEEFAYVVAHDLSEPLRAIISFAQILARRSADRLGSEARGHLDRIVEAGFRLRRRIQGLLDHCRVEAQALERHRIECEDVLGQVLTDLSPAIGEAGARVTHDPLPSIEADPSQILEVFQNLILNAIRYRREEAPHIHVAAEPKEGEWVFSIRDNGVGIAPEHRERIFRMFQTVGGSSSRERTGMGLAICSRVVERHGGRIWVDSKPGEGSTFYFSIPSIREPVAR